MPKYKVRITAYPSAIEVDANDVSEAEDIAQELWENEPANEHVYREPDEIHVIEIDGRPFEDATDSGFGRLEQLQKYHSDLKSLWAAREKADDDVTAFLIKIKEYDSKNQLSMSVMEDGRMNCSFCLEKQEQHHRVSSFLLMLERAISGGANG